MRAPRIHNRHRRAGFTLVEMLVAVAIFLALMAAVSLVFSLSVRLSEETFQKQEAFEIARAAMGVLEQDINRIYTSRDTGANSTFYGSPYGMTFIMKIQADNSPNFDLARVTYVFHRSAGSKVLQAQIDDNDPTETDADRVRPTYSLLRYVEPGVEDLDTFPVPWTNVVIDQGGQVNLQNLVDLRINDVLSGFNPSNLPPGFDCDDDCLEQLDRSLKREIWLRMLAGGDSFDVPNGWVVLDEFDGLFPEDYILAENIVQLDSSGDPITNPDFWPQVLDEHIADISDATLSANSALFAAPINGFFSYREMGTRNKPDEPLFGNLTDNLARPLTIVPNANGGNATIVENSAAPPLQEYAGIDLSYWNDIRNMEYQVRKTNLEFDPNIDQDRDGDVDPDDAAIAASNLRNPAAYIRTGSPLDPRLPEAVNVRFTLFLQAPSVGSPDYFETFTQRIPVPLGYRRPNEVL